MLYVDDVYGLNRSGSAKAITNITLDDIYNFLKTNCTRKNLHVIFAGDISRSDINSYLDILFKNLPEEYNAKNNDKIECPLSATKVATISRDGMKDIAVVMSAIRIDDMTDLEEAAAHILMETFFNKKNGDFVRELRKRKITCVISCHIKKYALSEVLFVSACLEKADLPYYLTYIEEKIDEYAVKLNIKDLERTQKYFVKLSGTGFSDYYNIDERIELMSLPFKKISTEDLKKVAEKLFNKQRLRTALIKSNS
jgi:predicted Zn-dependent peptidase